MASDENGFVMIFFLFQISDEPNDYQHCVMFGTFPRYNLGPQSDATVILASDSSYNE